MTTNKYLYSGERQDKSNVEKIVANIEVIRFFSKSYRLENITEENKLLMKAFKVWQLSDWTEKACKKTIEAKFSVIGRFIEFLNLKRKKDKNILKMYENYRINEVKTKKSANSDEQIILTILEQIKINALLTNEEKVRIHRICKTFKPARMEVPFGKNLTDWFNDIEWLRKDVGDYYTLIESPKLLMRSFMVTMATMLLFTLKARKQIKDSTKLSKAFDEIVKAQKIIGKNQHKRTAERRKAGSNILKTIKELEGENVSHAKEYLLCQLSNVKNEESFRVEIEKDNPNLEEWVGSRNQRNQPMIRELHLDYKEITLFEKWLMVMLLCGMAVQPDDVFILRNKNILYIKNKLGKVRTIQIKYYKGRSGEHKETEMLEVDGISASSPVGKAIFMYLDEIGGSPEKLLIDVPKVKGQSLWAIFPRLLHNRMFNEILENELSKYNVGNIFPYVTKFIFNEAAIIKNGRQSKEAYKATCEKPVPFSLFPARFVKKSAVHSKSDQYRTGSYLNYNSHTSLTEKTAYLNENNQDYMNRHGRIMRAVMDDLSKHAFKPSKEIVKLDNYSLEAQTKIVRTRIEQATETNDVKINKYGFINNEKSEKDAIVVIENIKTAVQMMHYIDQADKHADALIKNNSVFFEKDVLVTVEWMYYCISQMKTNVRKEAAKKHKEIKEYLPKLFDNEIKTGISV